MGATQAFVLFHLSLLLASIPYVSAAQNFPVPWASKKFGPDGPWQAVNITVGGNDTTKFLYNQNSTEVSVYPGGSWSTMTISSLACKNYPNTQCGVGGTWEPDDAQAARQPIAITTTWNDNATGINIPNARMVVLGLTINQKTVWNASLASARQGNITYPNGKVGGPTLGYLSLGADDKKQFFTTGSTTGKGINASMFAGQLSEDNAIPSYSYGLHIGSAAFNYPGSLVFGGYDKGRVIGPVSVFTQPDSIDLIDISIGVAAGGSPFNFTKKEKLLSSGQTSVSPEPLAPYLSLSPQTCDNIASNLPVTLDRDLGYYLWNTDDPNYKKIVSSAAYLGFTFPPQPGTSDNIMIKVPFALLNLTLESPIVDTPKQYFPCVPYKYKPKLGRAFLQAAFLGRNWQTKTSWLAQAPGPGVAKRGLGDGQNTDIPESATMIDVYPGDNLFTESWKGHWSLIDSQGNPANSNGNGGRNGNGRSSDDGLSTGAKAGIGVGAAIGAIAVIAGLVFFLRRRSAKNKNKNIDPHTFAHEAGGQPTEPYNDNKIPTNVYAHQQGHNGWNSQYAPMAELPQPQTAPVEIGDTSRNTQH